MMNWDISDILKNWEYDPYKITVRKIVGKDGKEKIQLRLDLGLLQMELDGRPDGKRPRGKESLLEYYESILQSHLEKYGTDKNFRLTPEDCAMLQREAIQYYHRYLSLFHLGDYRRAERDTARNLRVFDLVKKYAVDEQDVWAFEQYRPYVIMMNTRARSLQRLQKQQWDQALAIVEEGIRKIEDFFREIEQPDLIESNPEIQFLKDWAEEIRANRPLSPLEQLKRELQRAVEREEFERAAQLRDQIRKLSQKK